MSVLKNKRGLSKLEFYHTARKLREDITNLLLRDFGVRDKVYLKYCQGEIQKICETLGITVNKKKSKIIKLEHGIKFLKGVYSLAESGRIVRRAAPDSRKRIRRKLKKFKALMDAGKMSYGDVYTGYQSWRGNYLKRFDAYHTVRRMDGLYNGLFIA